MAATSPVFEEVLSTPEGQGASGVLEEAAAQVSVPELGKITEDAIVNIQ